MKTTFFWSRIWIADRGKYREFQERERKAREAAETLPPATGWYAQAAESKQRLLEKRMQYAWQLLSNGNLQVQQVAEQSGYASLAGFSDRFRRHFGVSPRHFRRINE